MTQTLGGVTLEKYAPGGFQQMIIPNATKVITLGGDLYVDSINVRSGWKISWDYISSSNYNTLRGIYNDQFTDFTFPTFVDSDLSINTSVYMSMPSERDIIWNKTYVKGLTITLEAASADSL